MDIEKNKNIKIDHSKSREYKIIKVKRQQNEIRNKSKILK